MSGAFIFGALKAWLNSDLVLKGEELSVQASEGGLKPGPRGGGQYGRTRTLSDGGKGIGFKCQSEWVGLI